MTDKSETGLDCVKHILPDSSLRQTHAEGPLYWIRTRTIEFNRCSLGSHGLIISLATTFAGMLTVGSSRRRTTSHRTLPALTAASRSASRSYSGTGLGRSR